MPENKRQSQEQFDEEELLPAAHATEITLCSVSKNDVGERVYAIYIEDSVGLKKPIGFEMIVHPDESVSFLVAENALEILSLLKPELVEVLEREEEEREKAERRAKS